LSLKISYPNAADKENAKKKKISPGKDIMIHGLGKRFSYFGELHTLHDWTLGCIAVTNDEIEEIWKLVQKGTIVKIEP
jgi:murein L,D-transpeptidase YafK